MRTIRWGLLGCGNVAQKRVATAIQQTPHCELLSVCRRDPLRLAAFRKATGVERSTTDAAKLLHDPDIDAVYIATPVDQHCPQTLQAAAAGKHVLVEKPMAMDVPQCEQMIAACTQADVRLGVAYYRRFYPIVQRIEELLRDQTIGTPLGVAAVTATPLAMQPGQDGYWRVDLSAGGGGPLMDVGSHRINVLLHLFGNITQVQAFCGNVAAQYEAEDSAVLLLRFETGLLGTLQCHFGADDPDEFVITGTRGRLIASPLNGDQLVIEIDGQRSIETLPPAANLCQPLVADFADAIRNHRPPLVDGREGLLTNMVMADAYRACGR